MHVLCVLACLGSSMQRTQCRCQWMPSIALGQCSSTLCDCCCCALSVQGPSHMMHIICMQVIPFDIWCLKHVTQWSINMLLTGVKCWHDAGPGCHAETIRNATAAYAICCDSKHQVCRHCTGLCKRASHLLLPSGSVASALHHDRHLDSELPLFEQREADYS